MKAHRLALTTLVFLTACATDEDEPDAYGNFEAAEVLVSSELGGRLTQFSAREGQAIPRGAVVGVIDTTQLALNKAQVQARKRAAQSRFPGISAQAAVLERQLSVAERELARIDALLEDGAATTKQRDDLTGQIEVLQQQIEAIRTGNAPVFAELDVLDAQIALLDDQIARARIVNPIGGTVLTSFAEETELTAPGKPLYRIASLDTLELRAYVSGAQLARVRVGQSVGVHVDANGTSGTEIPGVVSWISPEAEFTPKLIQTREERVLLVYAFTVRVPNTDGLLKIGMPGEVTLVD